LKPFGKTDKILGGRPASFVVGDDFPQEYLIYSLKEISIFLALK
jgi:hypothetical protein